MSDELLNSLSKLVSEKRNPDTMDLDTLSSLELVTQLNNQDHLVPAAIKRELPQIAKAVDAITAAFKAGGRLIYIGSGTSGRLGILDASECPPTFGVENNMVIGLISGGREAVSKSIENAEDSIESGQQDLISQSLSRNDIVVGIAASGRTPYVIGALRYAKSIECKTIAVSCNTDSEVAKYADISITPVVGPEVLTGSTRLKAGTAQKLVLNMLSTASMVKLGKCYQNLMVDVKATNEKLIARATRIVMQATGCNKKEATNVLIQSNYEVKPAILMQLTGVTYEKAQRSLVSSSGYLRRAIENST